MEVLPTPRADWVAYWSTFIWRPGLGDKLPTRLKRCRARNRSHTYLDADFVRFARDHEEFELAICFEARLAPLRLLIKRLRQLRRQVSALDDVTSLLQELDDEELAARVAAAVMRAKKMQPIEMTRIGFREPEPSTDDDGEDA